MLFRSGHVYIVLEPVGSARLTFGDDRYYEFMCFDVSKVVRSPGYDHVDQLVSTCVFGVPLPQYIKEPRGGEGRRPRRRAQEESYSYRE